jgi:hypothetical protein
LYHVARNIYMFTLLIKNLESNIETTCLAYFNCKEYSNIQTLRRCREKKSAMAIVEYKYAIDITEQNRTEHTFYFDLYIVHHQIHIHLFVRYIKI